MNQRAKDVAHAVPLLLLAFPLAAAYIAFASFAGLFVPLARGAEKTGWRFYFGMPSDNGKDHA